MPLTHLFKIKAKKGCNLHFSNRMACNPIYKIHLEPMCPLVWHVNKKNRPFQNLFKGKQRQNKGGRLGSMPLYYTLSDVPPLWSFPVMLAGRARPMISSPIFFESHRFASAKHHHHPKSKCRPRHLHLWPSVSGRDPYGNKLVIIIVPRKVRFLTIKCGTLPTIHFLVLC